jgi:hypothetical protein
VVCLGGGVGETGLDVFGRQIGIVPHDLVLIRTGCVQRQDVGHAHPRATDHRASVDDLRIDGDAVQQRMPRE